MAVTHKNRLMTKTHCLFCGRPETGGYKPGPGVDFTCSRCTQLLLGADQEDLKKAYARAIEKGYPGKAEAIKSFIIEDEFNVRKAEKFKRDMARKRPMRTLRPSHHKSRT